MCISLALIDLTIDEVLALHSQINPPSLQLREDSPGGGISSRRLTAR